MNNYTLIIISLSGSLFMGTANAQVCNKNAIEQHTPNSAFSFHSNGTVTHTPTGLTWKRCLEGQTFNDNSTPSNYLDDQCDGSAQRYNWQAALDQAQLVNNTGGFAGHTNWRMPNIKELRTIIEYCRENPAINTEVFPSTPLYSWTSSPVMNSPDRSRAWAIDFSNGVDNWNGRNSDGHVRLVRSP